MKKNIFYLVVFLLSLSACNRDFEFETVSTTEPALEVVVETMATVGGVPQYTKISGATVTLYNNETDYNTQANPLSQKTSNSLGVAHFTKAELVAKGVFYVRVSSGVLTGTGTTPYLLLNDGITSLFVRIQ